MINNEGYFKEDFDKMLSEYLSKAINGQILGQIIHPAESVSVIISQERLKSYNIMSEIKRSPYCSECFNFIRGTEEKCASCVHRVLTNNFVYRDAEAIMHQKKLSASENLIQALKDYIEAYGNSACLVVSEDDGYTSVRLNDTDTSISIDNAGIISISTCEDK